MATITPAFASWLADPARYADSLSTADGDTTENVFALAPTLVADVQEPAQAA